MCHVKAKATDAPLEPKKFGGHGRCDATSRSATLDNATDRSAVLVIETMRLFRQMKPTIADLRGVSDFHRRLLLN